MKRFDYRLIIGAVLILGGILMLLDRVGIWEGATGIFWAGILAAGASLFLYLFFTDRRCWWAAIPGFALAGMSASSLLLDRLGWGGLALLGGLGAGFWAIYIRERQYWWAIIPGGILVTLGIVSALSEAFEVMDTGGVFFVGLGLTFLLVAVLAGRKWGYIPAAVLLLLGFVLGAPFGGVFEYAWIVVLLGAGVVMIVSALRQP
jgi:hypothetical protein